ncbi:MAG TPA: phosphatidylcholine/phosphatidylserine synthase [Hyphomicrobiales bacterium]|nr:phosphatidylcholine/phosphatidylserine synthase [Hyphomicrobiales bacterium]
MENLSQATPKQPGKAIASDMTENRDPFQAFEPVIVDPETNRYRALAGLIPNILTLAAVLCGLTSIRLSGEGEFVLAMAAIYGAALLDVADGYAARRLSAQTAIGAQLDSLADFLNFGVAPAMLLYDRNLHQFCFGGWLVAALYVLATGLRLARFNAEANWDAEEKQPFAGLPSTGAAIAIVSLDGAAGFAFDPQAAAYVMMIAAIAAAALMVSKLRVPSLEAWLRLMRRKLKRL